MLVSDEDIFKEQFFFRLPVIKPVVSEKEVRTDIG